MDHEQRVAVEDADQMRVGSHAQFLAEQCEGHRIEGATDFDMTVGVHRPLATREERKGLCRQAAERGLLDVDEVSPDLPPRGAVNAEPRDRPIPLPKEGVVRIETVEPPAFQRVALDVAAATLLFPVFLWMARLRRQRREAPMRGEREIHIMAVGIEEADTDDGGFEIVMANDRRHAAEVAERALVQAQKRLELLVPDGFLVAMTRMTERHPKDPGPAPFAGGDVERRRPTEKIHLRFVVMVSSP